MFLAGDFQDDFGRNFILLSLGKGLNLVKSCSCEEIVLEDFIKLVSAVAHGNIPRQSLFAACIKLVRKFFHGYSLQLLNAKLKVNKFLKSVPHYPPASLAGIPFVIILQLFVSGNSFVEAINTFAVDDEGRVFFVSWLDAEAVIGFKKDPFEGCFVRHNKADEAIIAASDIFSGRENHDVTFAVFRLHRITDDPDSEGIGVVHIGAADVIIGDTGGIVQIVEVGRVTCGDFIYDGDETGCGEGGILFGIEFIFRKEGADFFTAGFIVNEIFSEVSPSEVFGFSGLILAADVGWHFLHVGYVYEQAPLELQDFFEFCEQFVAGRIFNLCRCDG
jgi:hypothetical protein